MKSILKDELQIVKDFPKKGIDFADITSIMKNGKVYAWCIDELSDYANEVEFDKIVGPESRGFVMGCPVSYKLKKGFIPVRKPGKLPREVLRNEYESEYEKNILEIHKDDIKKGEKVIIIDDVLATGGTINSILNMLDTLGAEVVGIFFLLEIESLKGKEVLNIDSNKIKVIEKI